MSETTSPDAAALPIVFFGLGSMGQAMCRRLRERGHEVIVWNRTVAKATAFALEESQGKCRAAPTASAALALSSGGCLVIMCLSDTLR